MSIYLHIPGVSGNVTARAYTGWIQLESVQHQLHRHIKPTHVGDGNNRDYSLPRLGVFELVKHMDNSSSPICQYFYSGKNIPTVEIVMTSDHDQNPYLSYTLDNVMVAYVHRFHDATQKRPLESIHLSYTRLEEKFTPYDESQRMGTPVSTGYDLVTAVSL